MSYFVAGAVVVSAVAGAASSRKASKDQAKGVKKGLDQSAALAAEARADAMQLFQRSSLAQRGGIEAALNFYKQSAPLRMAPFVQGNQAAQNVIGQGAQQANNAILGLPVDMSFTQQQQPQVDMSYMDNAVLPEYKPPFPEEEPVMGPEEQLENPNMIGAQPKKKESTTDKLWKYDPHNVMIKKPADSLKKKLSKIF